MTYVPTKSSGVEIGSARWNELVKIGREAQKSKDEARWIIADAILEIEPIGKGGADIGTGRRLAAYAKALDMATNTLINSRSTAAAWPPARRKPLLNSFSVHLALRALPDRNELIKTPMTSDVARRIVRGRVDEGSHASGNRKRALSDPQVKRVRALRSKGAPIAELAEKFNVSKATICGVVPATYGPRAKERLFQKVAIGLSNEQMDWITTEATRREISVPGVIRDLIDQAMKPARRPKARKAA